MLDTETICSPGDSTDGSGPPSLQNELENLKDESPVEEKVIPPQPIGNYQKHKCVYYIFNPFIPHYSILSIFTYPLFALILAGRSTTHKEQRSANTLYQELSFQDNEESEEHEVTGKYLVLVKFV